MAVQLPTPSQLLDVAHEIGLDLTDDDVTSFLALLGPNIAAYNVVDSMAERDVQRLRSMAEAVPGSYVS
jgi:amidase